MHGFIASRDSIPPRLTLHASSFLVRCTQIHLLIILWVELSGFSAYTFCFLGGDPAAGSPTATLLRLNPPYEPQVRHDQQDRASPETHSGGSTGSVCKEQGRIHCAIVTRGY